MKDTNHKKRVLLVPTNKSFPISAEELSRIIAEGGLQDLLQRVNTNRLAFWTIVLAYMSAGITAFLLGPEERGWVLVGFPFLGGVIHGAILANDRVISQLKALFSFLEESNGLLGLESVSRLFADFRGAGSQTKALLNAVVRATCAFSIVGLVSLYQAGVPIFVVLFPLAFNCWEVGSMLWKARYQPAPEIRSTPSTTVVER